MHSTCTGTGTWRLGTGTCTGTGTCLLSTWYKTDYWPPASGVVYNFGAVCLFVCIYVSQTNTCESLDVGFSFSHIRYITRGYGLSSYIKVIGSTSRSQEQNGPQSLFLQCISSSSSSSSSSLKFLEWPKQQRHHEDHYRQSKYAQYQTVL